MLIGKGSPNEWLDEKQIFELCAEAFSQSNLDGKRVLAIVPDFSRTAPMDVMFRIVQSLLGERACELDFLFALGTHPPMTAEDMYRRVGITPDEHKENYSRSRFFNHSWNNQDHLQAIGILSEDEISDISGGLMSRDVPVTINKRVFDYDVLLIIGPTFPHEVAGFSGGNKYLFPGIAGEEIIHLFHWLGALITSPGIIGLKETPVRKVIDKSASLLPMERLCLSLVVHGAKVHGLYIGSPEQASLAAADLSKKIHIIYKDHPFQKVLSCAPPMYTDLWTGAKCMYKLEPVVDDGGELIIYAPHIENVSVTHGGDIRKIGYHVRDYFLKQWDRFKHVSGCVMAHSTHVKGIGTYENGFERPRIQVTLATSISKSVCEEINLGYCDPNTINIKEYENKEDEGILYVPKAGEILYRLDSV
jgi:nickel-dependent lactate racemase